MPHQFTELLGCKCLDLLRGQNINAISAQHRQLTGFQRSHIYRRQITPLLIPNADICAVEGGNLAAAQCIELPRT